MYAWKITASVGWYSTHKKRRIVLSDKIFRVVAGDLDGAMGMVIDFMRATYCSESEDSGEPIHWELYDATRVVRGVEVITRAQIDLAQQEKDHEEKLQAASRDIPSDSCGV